MNRAIMLAAVAATALTVGACQRQEETTDIGQSEPVNAAQDAASAAVGATSAATVGQMSTDAFVSNATESSVYEVEAGKLAQQKGQTAGVKTFGQQMVTDHTAMLNEMKPVAIQAGFTPPAELDERRKGLLDNLRAANGAEFDRVYLDQQEAAHEEALTLMRGYAENGDNAALKDAAAKSAPKIQAHLEKVNQLKAAMPAQ